MKVQKIAYIRVSSTDQNPDRQLPGLEFDRKFIDYASGATTNRPEFQNMMKYLREGDTLYIHSLDRLARNLNDLISIVQELIKRGVFIKFIHENLEFTGNDSPMSMFFLSMMGAFAEFERKINRERQKEGIELAKKKGIYKGRKTKLSADQLNEIIRLAKEGFKKSRIAEMFNISRESVYRYLTLNKNTSIDVK